MEHSKTYVYVTILGIISAISIFLVLSWFSALTVPGMNHAPVNEFEVQVFVNNNNPLTITLNLKSLNDHHFIEFRRVEILDKNENIVAEYQGITTEKMIGEYEYTWVESIFTLPEETEKVVRLNFNTTMLQGKYSLILFCDYFSGLMPVSYTHLTLPTILLV